MRASKNRYDEEDSVALDDRASPIRVYAFADDIVRNLPRLERFARRLAGNKSLADDLVQDTVLRALLHADQFRPGTNLIAWLNAILRNAYRKDYRRQHLIDWLIFEEQAEEGRDGGQEWHLRTSEVKWLCTMLPAEQREALLLVGANGFRYEDAALLAGCAAGTMKSRVSRGRARLRQALEDLDSDEVVSPDPHETGDQPSSSSPSGRVDGIGQEFSCAKSSSAPMLRKAVISHRAA
jgi:RNA polymerase sigma-70 factor, ECF subfamily